MPFLAWVVPSLFWMNYERTKHPPSLTSAVKFECLLLTAQVCCLLWEGKCKAAPLVHPAGWKEPKAENSQPLALLFNSKSCSGWKRRDLCVCDNFFSTEGVDFYHLINCGLFPSTSGFIILQKVMIMWHCSVNLASRSSVILSQTLRINLIVD